MYESTVTIANLDKRVIRADMVFPTHAAFNFVLEIYGDLSLFYGIGEAVHVGGGGVGKQAVFDLFGAFGSGSRGADFFD